MAQIQPSGGFEVELAGGITLSEWVEYLLIPGYADTPKKWKEHVSYTLMPVPEEVSKKVDDLFGISAILLVWWDMNKPSTEQIVQRLQKDIKETEEVSRKEEEEQNGN